MSNDLPTVKQFKSKLVKQKRLNERIGPEIKDKGAK